MMLEKERSGAARTLEVIRWCSPGSLVSQAQLGGILAPEVSAGAISGFLNYAMKKGILERAEKPYFRVKDLSVQIDSRSKRGSGVPSESAYEVKFAEKGSAGVSFKEKLLEMFSTVDLLTEVSKRIRIRRNGGE